MQTYYSTAEFYIPYPTIVTIGMFDGVHVWHRRIIQDLVTRAQELDLESVVLTFWPHPREVLTGVPMQCLTTTEEKIALMEELGVDHVIVQSFTPDFAQMSAQDYMQTILVDQLHADVVMIWHDHRFGHDRGAGLEELAAFGYSHGFSVTQIPVHEIDEAAVSSTVIRQALLWWDITRANQYLGYQYQLTGVARLERKFRESLIASFTIPEWHKLIPADGEYIVRIGEYDRKLVIGDDGLELYLLESDSIVFGQSLMINFRW